MGLLVCVPSEGLRNELLWSLIWKVTDPVADNQALHQLADVYWLRFLGLEILWIVGCFEMQIVIPDGASSRTDEADHNVSKKYFKAWHVKKGMKKVADEAGGDKQEEEELIQKEDGDIIEPKVLPSHLVV